MKIGKINSLSGMEFNKNPVSFDGHHKTVTIREEGRNVCTSKSFLYGSGENVSHSLDYYAGHSYRGADFMHEQKRERWVTDGFEAKMDGSDKIGTDKFSQEKALIDAIIKSKYFMEGSTIQKLREPYGWRYNTRADVYFSDEYELVDHSVIKDKTVNYLVMAPNAKLAPEPKPKPFWKKLLG